LIVASQEDATWNDPRLRLEAGLAARVAELVEGQCYRLPGWAGEDGIHYTGDLGESSTHGWVRVWYSPEVLEWLNAGRPEGEVPEEAIIVKERFEPIGAPEEGVFKLVGWQPMVRRPADSRDGWFWGDISQEEARHGQIECSRPPLSWDQPETLRLDDCRPPSRFGQPCLRCHASAPDFTFAQKARLPEVTGGALAEEQIIYDYRRLWRDIDADDPANKYADYKNEPPATFIANHPDRADLIPARPIADPAFVAQFEMPADESAPDEDIPRFFDHVVPKAGGNPDTFLTSDQCQGCHSGVAHLTQGSEHEGSMLARDGHFPDGKARYTDVSPYGEWSVSMMALAGRDPIFRAQREWEADHRSDCADEITDLCYKCHGAAGHRQLKLDDPARKFDHAIVFDLPDEPDGKYGALARDGITCSVCHQMSGKDLGKPASYTGNWTPTAPGDVVGPYADGVRVDPMKRALGKTPSGEDGRAAILKSAALCGSCHAVKLPVRKVGSCVDEGSVYEQATFLEWRNSNYRKNDEFITDEGKDGETPVPCQGCHMPKKFNGKELKKKIASIEDAEFPTSNLQGVPDVHADVDIAPRAPFARHQLNGINLFALSMFAQAPRVFGLADFDYMSNQYGEPTRLQMAAALAAGRHFADTAASISISELKVVTEDGSEPSLQFKVKVTNKAGHKLPSGVAFRRAFLEVAVEDAFGNALWISGRTNSSGVILGGGGQVLATEFAETTPEPHHKVITSEDEVQIYEERVVDSDGKLTTSFLSIYDTVKDNRLLPAGWKANFAPTMENGQVPHGLEPKGLNDDSEYPDSGAPACGCDVVEYRVPFAAVMGLVRVRARLNYQSIPPYYLRDRFSVSLPDAKRLYKIASHLDTGPDSPIPGWKLMLTEAVRDWP
jgi:cytochrome c553